jgi:hypothetical protein
VASSTGVTRSKPARARGRSASTQRGADEQHGQGAEAGQRLHERVEQSAYPADRDQPVAQFLGAVAEALGLGGLPAEGLHDQGGVEALVRDLADLGAQLLGPLHPRAHHLRVDDVRAEDQREHHQPDDGEQRVREHERHPGDRDHHQGADGERQRGDEEPGGLDVGVGVGQQLPRGVPLVPRQRQPQVLAGDPAAVVGLQAVAHDAGEEPAPEDAEDLEDRHGEDGDGGQRQRTRRRDAGVERGEQDAAGDLADDVGAGDGHPAVDAAAEDGEGEHALLLPDGPADVAEPASDDGVAAAGHRAPSAGLSVGRVDAT